MSTKRISDFPQFSKSLPPLQKLQSLKWKIGAKARKKQKQNICWCYFCSFRKKLNEF